MKISAPPFTGFSRRAWLSQLGGGFGALALAQLLHGETPGAVSAGERTGLHFPAKAKRVIQLFMNGGASQMDLFDYKPELIKRHGEKFDPGAGIRVEAATSEPGKLMKSPFAFQRHGQCARWVSDLLPNLAKQVDDIALLPAVESRTNVHGPASYLMNTGFLLPGFPCLGAWVSYGLGSLTDNLPTFVVLPDPRGLPYNAKGNFTSGFLPVQHAGTVIRPDPKEPIGDLAPPAGASFITPAGESEGRRLLQKLNQRHLHDNPGDSRLEGRIAGYELAAKMQLAAPEAFDISAESKAVHELYGVGDPVTEDFGRRCLLGRRLLERGVRFVQIWSGAGGAEQ